MRFSANMPMLDRLRINRKRDTRDGRLANGNRSHRETHTWGFLSVPTHARQEPQWTEIGRPENRGQTGTRKRHPGQMSSTCVVDS